MHQRLSSRLTVAALVLCACPALLPSRAQAAGEIYWFSLLSEDVDAAAAFYARLLGWIVALLAIPTGFADWTDIRREKPAWKLGLYHMGLNVLVVILWAINLWLRVETI